MKSYWTIIALAVGVLAMGFYTYRTTSGYVPESAERSRVPDNVRKSPDGYRNFHFWHVGHGGYRGGK